MRERGGEGGEHETRSGDEMRAEGDDAPPPHISTYSPGGAPSARFAAFAATLDRRPPVIRLARRVPAESIIVL